nr:60S ribosomal protein L23a-like [Oryctolagus cuniculus]
MALKTKKEAPAPPKAQAKTKAFTAKKPNYPQKSTPRRSKLDCYAIVKFPLTTEQVMEKIEHNTTLVFIVDVRASKHHIKQAVKKHCDIDVANVNTLIRPME